MLKLKNFVQRFRSNIQASLFFSNDVLKMTKVEIRAYKVFNAKRAVGSSGNEFSFGIVFRTK